MSLRNDIAKLKAPAPIPKGWATTDQIAKNESMGVSQTRKAVQMLIDVGQWESKKWQIQNPDGSVKTLPIYRKKSGSVSVSI